MATRHSLTHHAGTAFVDVDGFKAAFKAQALSLFGSGYTWLVVDTSAEPATLRVVNTPNQDRVPSSLVPVLTLDLWEHAYYPNYENRRAEFVDEWWRIVDWGVVDRRYRTAVQLDASKTEL